MKIKSCLTCKYLEYEGDLHESTGPTRSFLVKTPLCMHKASEGKTTEEMVNGACGRDRVLWIRREKVETEDNS